MFTGLVQAVGEVRRSRLMGLELNLSVDVGRLSGDIDVGDSIAVDGVCLTAVDLVDGCARFDVSRETLSRTILGAKLDGNLVNLELALLPTTRLGGHFVTGHVDGIGSLETLQRVGGSSVMGFHSPPELSRYIAEKGSICIDGVSLTVNQVAGSYFEVNIVPHTMQATTMGTYETGRRVHLEIDIIARYLDRLMDTATDARRQTETSPDEAQPQAPPADVEASDETDEITQRFLSGQGFVAPDLGE